VIVGAGTLRAFPRHLWTPEAIYAPLANEYAALRAALGKTRPAQTVLVTARGELDPAWPVLHSKVSPCVVVTTGRGARVLAERGVAIETRVAGEGPALRAAEILDALHLPAGTEVLLECGPHLMGRFFDERLVDELFLTVAPQLGGRSTQAPRRDGFVAEALFLPDRPLWGELRSVRRSGGMLFLRYRFR
jgi:riboflavin biosynthesis pyrimidine reductase